VTRSRRRTDPLDVATLERGTLVKVKGRSRHLPFAFQYVRQTPSGGVEVTLYGPRGRDGRISDKQVVNFITVTPDMLVRWG
jgi:hypothetical protein